MIKLKGMQAGILKCVVPEDLSEKKMLEDFSELAENGASVLKGSSVVMDMGDRPFTQALVGKIWKNFIEPTGCRVIHWMVTDPSTRDCLSRTGIIIEAQKAGRTDKGLLYMGNLRSGQTVNHDGDVLIAGNVHTGAEVCAKGHIVVLGRLKGVVHAGCDGDTEMSVTVRSLETGQVRIAGRLGMIDGSSDMWGKPVVIKVRDKEVLLEEWPAL